MDKERKSTEIMTNWDIAMQNGNMSALQRSVEQVIKLMKDGIFCQQYTQLNDLFRGGAKKIEAWGNLLDIDSKEVYSQIFAYAVFWTSNKIVDGLHEKYLIEDRVQRKYEEVKQLRSSKYLYPVLDLLEKNGELPQGAIAKQLSISTNSLSNFLRRNEKYGLWDHERFGKYSYYHLTNQGKDYLAIYQKKEIEEKSSSINDVLIYFMDCLSDEMEEDRPDFENILHKMNKKFGKTQAIFGGSAEKIALRKVMWKTTKQMRKREKRWEDLKQDDHYYTAFSNGKIIDLEEKDFYILERTESSLIRSWE